VPAAERSEFAEQLPRFDEVLLLVFAAGGASPGKQHVHSVRRIALGEQDLTGLEPANDALRLQPFESRFSHCHSSTSAGHLVEVIGGLPREGIEDACAVERLTYTLLGATRGPGSRTL